MPYINEVKQALEYLNDFVEDLIKISYSNKFKEMNQEEITYTFKEIQNNVLKVYNACERRGRF